MGWTAVLDSCYKVSSDANVTKSAAIERCRDEGGFLAVVTSAAERDAIQSLFRSDGSFYVYVDGSDAELEGTWKTQTGETIQSVPFQQPAWFSDTEPNGGSFENCLLMSRGYFGDIHCENIESGALCELSLDY